MDLHHEEEGLWDELNHQQSREIQQHHARTARYAHAALPFAADRQFAVLRRMAQQTQEETTRFSRILYEAAADAWREHEERRQRERFLQHNHRSSSDPHNTYLQDFGIATGDDDHTYTPTSHEHGENDFIFLPQISNSQHYGAAANLDVFFASLYSYFYHRGLVPIVGKGVVQLVSLLFTLFLSIFLFVYMDWKALATCMDETTCRSTLADYIHQRPFSHGSVWTLLVACYVLIFLVYAAFATWSCLHTIREAIQAKYVFEERLGISARKLEGGAVDWDRDVVDKILELQQSGEYRVAIHGQDLDALIIANRILRKENFMVALFNRDLLDLNVPWLGKHVFFCSSLEWSIYFCIHNFLFNHKYQIRPAFYLDPGALRRRFMLCGIVHLLFLPFLLLFTVLHFGLQNVYDWKSTKRYLGPREWALSSRWIFREFNELQHHFESRLYPSYEATESYLGLFGQNEVVAAFGRILVFIGGSLGAVLFVFAAINDAILLHVKIADWNLLWYAGVVGVMYSIGKAMIPSEEARPRRIRNLHVETDAALANVATHTHHYNPQWKGKAHDETTYTTIKSMFQFKAQLFLMELASLMLAPYILCLQLVHCSETICEFIFLTKANIAGAGEVCGYATFDFDRFGDEAWEGRTLQSGREDHVSLSQSLQQTRNLEEARRQLPVPKARLGKMEKSFFSFKATHPSWKCSPSGQNLVDRIERYKHEESAALAREQDLHIKAAARQLETLADLEQRQPQQASPVRIVESHIPKPQAPADAGAGSLQSFTTDNPSTNKLPLSTLASFPPAVPDHYLPSQAETADDLHPFVTSQSLTPQLSSLAYSLSNRAQVGGTLSTVSNTFPSHRLATTGGMSLALSSELRRILNMSTLDPEVSLLATGGASDEDYDRRTERQYMWLERYHNHMASQQGQSRADSSNAGGQPIVDDPESGQSML